MEYLLAVTLLIMLCAIPAGAREQFPKDTIPTGAGELELTFIGHGSLLLSGAGQIIHVDPYARLADYAKLPPADLILVTHDHYDHLDPAALQAVRTAKTQVVLTEACARKVAGGTVLKNGEARTLAGIEIRAVPAYNIVHKRDGGQPFHPKGEGNGYVLSFGATRVYIAGDTENIPEMKTLQGIDVAFLPMNLPYTMTPEMVAEAARAFMPRILYPYHTGETDTARLVELLRDTPQIEVRLRPMK